MASRSLGTLTVDLVAKIGGFTRGMTEAERATAKAQKQIEQRMQRVAKSIDAGFRVAAAALAAVGGALAVGVRNAINQADALDEMSQRSGIAVETLSRLQLAAKAGAIEMETLEKSVGRLAVRQQEYAEGNKDVVALFDALGVKAVDAAGNLRGAEDVLTDLSAVFSTLPDGAQKTALAIEMFGKAGQQLIPFLNLGPDRLRELNDQADRLGVTLSSETAAAASQFNDELELLQAGVTGVAQAVAAELLPDMLELTGAMKENALEGNNVATTAENIANGIRGVAFVAGKAFDAIKALTLGIVGMTATVAEFLATYTLIGRMATSPEQRQMLADLAAVSLSGSKEAIGSFAGIAPAQSEADRVGIGRGRRGGGPMAGNSAPAVDLSKLKDYTNRTRDAAAASQADAEAKRAAAEAARELERAEAELARQMEENARIREDFLGGLESFEAQLDGPLAEAELEHKRRMQEVQELLDKGLISVDEATRAQYAYGQAIAKTRDELDPYGEGLRTLLEDMQFEYDLLGKTNAQRVAENELRRLGIDLTTEQGQATKAAIEAEVEAYEARQKTISAMDEFRNSFADNVASVLDGSKSIKDAVKDMVADLLAQFARLAAQKWTEQLFGAMGTSQTGSAGGGWMSLFGSFFGGGKAVGGPVMSGVPYLVGERGPELVVPSSSGTVIPAGKTASILGGPRGDSHYHFHDAVSRRSLDRLAIDQNRRQRRETARTG
jgi:hypothetical protein